VRRNSLPTGVGCGEMIPKRRSSCPNVGPASGGDPAAPLSRGGSAQGLAAFVAGGRRGSAVGGSGLAPGRRGSCQGFGGGADSQAGTRRASCNDVSACNESVLGEGCRLASREAVTNALATGRLDRRITTLVEQLRHDLTCTVQVTEEHMETMLEEFEERQREELVRMQEQQRSANMETHLLIRELTVLLKDVGGGGSFRSSSAAFELAAAATGGGRRASASEQDITRQLQGAGVVRRRSFTRADDGELANIRASESGHTSSMVLGRRGSHTRAPDEGVQSTRVSTSVPESPSTDQGISGARRKASTIPTRKESLAARISGGLGLKKLVKGDSSGNALERGDSIREED